MGGIITSFAAMILVTLFTSSKSLIQKLLVLKLYSQTAGTAAAKTLAATDPTIGQVAGQVVDGLNGNYQAALQSALTASGVTEDTAIATAEKNVEDIEAKALSAAGITDATIQALIISIEEPTITAALKAEYEKLTGTTAASTT